MPRDILLTLIIREFAQMPGMRLTAMQAARLLGVDEAVSEESLAFLVTIGFLEADDDGHASSWAARHAAVYHRPAH